MAEPLFLPNVRPARELRLEHFMPPSSLPGFGCKERQGREVRPKTPTLRTPRAVIGVIYLLRFPWGKSIIELHHEHREFPDDTAVELLYEGTAPRAELERIMARLIATHRTDDPEIGYNNGPGSLPR